MEQLLTRWVSSYRTDSEAADTLDWVDLRDLVAVARTTMDARLFAEVEERIARRGKAVCVSVSSVSSPTARKVTLTSVTSPRLCSIASSSHAQVKTRRSGNTISR